MPRRRPISIRELRRADRTVRRVGLRRSLRRLELIEPELSDFLMEGYSDLYATVDRACSAFEDVRAIHDATMKLILVCLAAARQNHRT